jgi:sucrose-phosphate synthase
MDNLVLWVKEQPRVPDFIHSHYADAGYVGVRLANLAAVPLVHTGHSLGRDKRKRLLAKGMSSQEIESAYNMARRISAEEELLANADLVITSTHNEIEVQYGLYNYYDPERMTVIPPGTDLEMFHPPKEGESLPFAAQIEPFLSEPGKPLVLALSRPDERKNIPILLQAFEESEALREAANLLIIAGNREDIRDLDPAARSVLTDLLLTVDSMNLYGCVALPKRHRPEQVPEIYRLTAASGGVFINPALTEPFGLTLLEAAATGLPLVATENGGPVDIIANCRNGILVDPLDSSAIAAALLELLTDRDAWSEASRRGLEGVRRHYTWQAHAASYLGQLEGLRDRPRSEPVEWPAGQSPRYRDRAIFSDLDQTLLGDPDALQRLGETIRRNRRRVSFGIATGRLFESALATMKRHGVPTPDVLISGLGTRIHYGASLSEDRHWAEHIDHQWSRDRVRRILHDLPGLKPQPSDKQSRFKVSYYYDPEKAPPPDDIIAMLHQKEVTANVMVSFGQFLDILPSRASKGQALRYAALRLDIPLEHILVAGGSGADEDMMRGNTLAVVVGNRHHEELSQLIDADRIHFSDGEYAAGLLDAIEYYDFFGSCRAPEDA